MNSRVGQSAIRIFLLVVILAGSRPVAALNQNVDSNGLASEGLPRGTRAVRFIAPADTDPAIRNFLNNNIVISGHTSASQNLLVFLTGTSGSPFGVINFLKVAAEGGYRAIGLEYDDTPAAAQVCQRERDRSCYERFREKRIYGTNVTDEIADLPAESIVNRLTKLLEYMDRNDPGEGWGDYLENGKPKWERIAVAGHSQGAGMAAFIAKHERVARVILFSGPQDYYGWDHEIAPWITDGKSATPQERWYAAYHKKEREASALKRAYQVLHIERDHLLMMTLEPKRMIGNNPYHVSMVGLATPMDTDGKPAYAPQWSFMLGVVTRPESGD